MAKQKTISRSELSKLSFLNSPPLAVALQRYRRMEWVGVGWIDCGEPKGDEVMVVEDSEIETPHKKIRPSKKKGDLPKYVASVGDRFVYDHMRDLPGSPSILDVFNRAYDLAREFSPLEFEFNGRKVTIQ